MHLPQCYQPEEMHIDAGNDHKGIVSETLSSYEKTAGAEGEGGGVVGKKAASDPQEVFQAIPINSQAAKWRAVRRG